MVPAIVSRVAVYIGVGDFWGRNVIAAPPELRLQLAEGQGCLVLVEALECSIVPFVQPPVLFVGHPHLIYPLRYDVVREDRPFQN